MGKKIARAYCSPSVMVDDDAKITGFLMGILVTKSCPNRTCFVMVDPACTKVDLLVGNKSLNAYGQCSELKKVCLLAIAQQS